MGQYKEEHGTTRIGDFLRKAGPIGSTILQAAGGLTGQPWLTKIGELIDESTNAGSLTIEQKNIALEMLKLDLEDMKSARDMNIRIQEADKSSWMSKNLPYIFDCFVLALWGFVSIYIVLRWMGILESSPATIDMTGILGLYSGIVSLATMVIQFHRGSSSGSREKTQMINNSK